MSSKLWAHVTRTLGWRPHLGHHSFRHSAGSITVHETGLAHLKLASRLGVLTTNLKSICHASNLEFTAEIVQPDRTARSELHFKLSTRYKIEVIVLKESGIVWR